MRADLAAAQRMVAKLGYERDRRASAPSDGGTVTDTESGEEEEDKFVAPRRPSKKKTVAVHGRKKKTGKHVIQAAAAAAAAANLARSSKTRKRQRSSGMQNRRKDGKSTPSSPSSSSPPSSSDNDDDDDESGNVSTRGSSKQKGGSKRVKRAHPHAVAEAAACPIRAYGVYFRDLELMNQMLGGNTAVGGIGEVGCTVSEFFPEARKITLNWTSHPELPLPPDMSQRTPQCVLPRRVCFCVSPAQFPATPRLQHHSSEHVPADDAAEAAEAAGGEGEGEEAVDLSGGGGGGIYPVVTVQLPERDDLCSEPSAAEVHHAKKHTSYQRVRRTVLSLHAIDGAFIGYKDCPGGGRSNTSPPDEDTYNAAAWEVYAEYNWLDGEKKKVFRLSRLMLTSRPQALCKPPVVERLSPQVRRLLMFDVQ